MEDLVRKNLSEIKPYVPGRPIDEIRRKYNLKKVIKLASNENPLPPPPSVRRAISKAVMEANRYPDGDSYYLKSAVSDKLGVKNSNLIFGNGSDEIIDIIIKAFMNDGEEVVTSDTTFLEYEIVSRINSRRVVLVPLKGLKYDLEAMLKAINARTKLVFIANPNNPTGTYVDRRETEDFLARVPDNVIVIFDEAYSEFIDADDFPRSMSYLDKNVILLRTFSKAYALAGLRLGFAVAGAEFIKAMEKVRQPFNVNSLAQAAAIAAINDERFLAKTKSIVRRGKKYLYKVLDKTGIEYVRSEANFILVDLKRDCAGVFEEMLRYGLIVRDMKQYGLSTYIRVTIGTEEENRKFVGILNKVMRAKENQHDNRLKAGRY